MHFDGPIRRDEPEPPVGSSELAEGLMLVRASTLKMIRLQLAMERQDRKVALEAVDDLVALDRRLQRYLEDVPSAQKQLLFRDALDAERELLDREKLTLAAGVIRRPEPEPAIEAAGPADDDRLGPRDLNEVEPVQRRRRWWIAAVPIAGSAAAASAYAVWLPEVQAWVVAAMRAFQ